MPPASMPQQYHLKEALVYQIAALLMVSAEVYTKLRPVLRAEYFAEDPESPLRVIVERVLSHAKDWGKPPSWDVLGQLVDDHLGIKLMSRREDDAAAVRALYRQTFQRLRDADTKTDRAWLEQQAIMHAEDQALGRVLLASASSLEVANGDRARVRRQMRKDFDVAFNTGASSKDLGSLYSDRIIQVFDDWISGEFHAGRIPTGWAQIDHALEGGFGRELVVIAGEAHSFKTGVCINIAAAAMAGGHFVAWASYEGEEPAILFRLGRRVARLKKQLVRDTAFGLLKPSLLRHRPVGGDLAVKYFSRRKAGVDEVEGWLAGLTAEGRRPDMLIIDYADKMAPPGRHFERNDLALSAIYDELSGLSHEFPGGPEGRKGMPVVTPSQVKQGAFGKRVVSMADLAGAIDKAAIADVILVICQTKWEKEQTPQVMRLFRAKAREAENLGFAWFHQDKDSMMLEECAPVEIPEHAL